MKKVSQLLLAVAFLIAGNSLVSFAQKEKPKKEAKKEAKKEGKKEGKKKGEKKKNS